MTLASKASTILDGLTNLIDSDIRPTISAHDIVHLTSQLLDLMSSLEDHLKVEQEISELEIKVWYQRERRERALRQLCETEQLLCSILARRVMDVGIAAIAKSRQNPVNVNTLIEYAHRLSATTSAPPHWQPGQPLGQRHCPPQPQEDAMRASLLYEKESKESIETVNAVNMEQQQTDTLPIQIKRPTMPTGVLDLDLDF